MAQNHMSFEQIIVFRDVLDAVHYIHDGELLTALINPETILSTASACSK